MAESFPKLMTDTKQLAYRGRGRIKVSFLSETMQEENGIF